MLNKKCRKGLLLVISSPSGGGKTTIYRKLLDMGDPFSFSVSATTRPPRPEEINGVHYRFISDEEFDRMVKNNRFAEWAHVHGYRYGTPKEYVEKALTEGMVMIFEIDVQGAAQLKAAYPDDAVLVFVVPPSAAETERRLRARKTNTEEDIQIRLKNAREEIRHWEDFDYLVYNDRLEDAIQDVLYIARAEQLETKRFSCDIWPD